MFIAGVSIKIPHPFRGAMFATGHVSLVPEGRGVGNGRAINMPLLRSEDTSFKKQECSRCYIDKLLYCWLRPESPHFTRFVTNT
jgi:hypothetical protein